MQCNAVLSPLEDPWLQDRNVEARATASLLRAAQLGAASCNYPSWVSATLRPASTSVQIRKEHVFSARNAETQSRHYSARNAPTRDTLEDNQGDRKPEDSGFPDTTSQVGDQPAKRHQGPAGGFAVDWSMMTSAGVGDALREMLMELAHVGIHNYRVRREDARHNSRDVS